MFFMLFSIKLFKFTGSLVENERKNRPVGYDSSMSTTSTISLAGAVSRLGVDVFSAPTPLAGLGLDTADPVDHRLASVVNIFLATEAKPPPCLPREARGGAPLARRRARRARNVQIGH
jgi:hypothetical protein